VDARPATVDDEDHYSEDAPMTSTRTDAHDEAGRLAWLEARVRWLTAVSTFLTVVVVALLVWQFLPRNRVVEAHRFVLRDAQWRRRAEIGLRDDGSAMLRLNNSDQRARIMMFVRDDGTAKLRFTDSSGVHRAELALGADGLPLLLFADSGGRSRVVVGTPGGSAAITLRGPDQKTVWAAP
jgi:hypothetical protein